MDLVSRAVGGIHGRDFVVADFAAGCDFSEDEFLERVHWLFGELGAEFGILLIADMRRVFAPADGRRLANEDELTAEDSVNRAFNLRHDSRVGSAFMAIHELVRSGRNGRIAGALATGAAFGSAFGVAGGILDVGIHVLYSGKLKGAEKLAVVIV